MFEAEGTILNSTALPPHVPIAEGKEGASAGHLARLW